MYLQGCGLTDTRPSLDKGVFERGSLPVFESSLGDVIGCVIDGMF